MLRIGLTGSIASGKSTAGRILAALGARVVDADRLAHEAYAPGSEGFRRIVDAFGPSVLGPDGAIDRRALGEIVFNDPARLDLLSRILWPLVRARVEELMRQAEAEGVAVFVVEAALLLEAGWADLFDEVWLVRAARETAIERLRERGGFSEAEAASRLAAQPQDSLRLQAADRVIDNDAGLDALTDRVREALDAALARNR